MISAFREEVLVLLFERSLMGSSGHVVNPSSQDVPGMS